MESRGALRRRLAGGCLALLLVAAAACTDSEPSAKNAESPAQQPDLRVPGLAKAETGPEPAQAQPFRARASVPGWRTITCPELRPGHPPRTVVVELPVEVYEITAYQNTCRASIDIDHEWSLVVSPTESLAHKAHKDIEPALGPNQGDGATLSASYHAAAKVFGRPGGEILRADLYNDGLPIDVGWFQNRGVGVQVTVPEKASRRKRTYAEGVLGTVAVKRGREGVCIGSTTTLTFRPPMPQTQSIDYYRVGGKFGPASCHLYLRPGRFSLRRHAEIRPDPRRHLGRSALLLAGNKRLVGEIVFQTGVATVAGEQADRLIWKVQERPHHGLPGRLWRLVTVQSPRVAVPWGATPRQWRQETDDYLAFLRSVQVREP